MKEGNIKKISGTIEFEVEGVINYNQSSKLTDYECTRRYDCKIDDIVGRGDDGILLNGDNHQFAKVTSDGIDYTSSNALNSYIFKEFAYKQNAGEMESPEKVMGSFYGLARGAACLEGRFTKSKALLVQNAYSEGKHLTFETRTSSAPTKFADKAGKPQKNKTKIFSRDTAGKRTQKANFDIALDVLSTFMLNPLCASTMNTRPKLEEETLNNLKENFLSVNKNIDVSNIKTGDMIRSKKGVFSVDGFVFTQEQLLILVKYSILLLKKVNYANSHGKIKFSKIDLWDQDGNKVDLKKLSSSDLYVPFEQEKK
jgi:hypothetical protein